MTDDEFIAVLEQAADPARPADGPVQDLRFGHVEHLRMAWILQRRYGARRGSDAAADLLRRIASAHGHGERYHETMTRFWLRLVALAAREAGTDSFDALLTAHPGLRESSLLDRHYSAGVIWSDAARRSFVLPDRRPVP